MANKKTALSDKKMFMRAVKDSFIKLNPAIQAENPVMLLVYISAVLTTLLWIVSVGGASAIGGPSAGYTAAIAIILWLTCVFANFAEAIAEGRGKAQADALRAAKKDVKAFKLNSPDTKEKGTTVLSCDLKKGDIVYVNAGEDKGKTGRVLRVLVTKSKAVVEGINIVSKSAKPSAKHPQGGIIKMEAPIHISNLNPVDKNGKPTRIGRRKNDEGKTVRYSKNTGEEIK